MLFDKYEIELTLVRDMLGTNPLDPNILDTHIIQKQRDLILEKSKINKEINKYLDQLDLDNTKTDEEINKVIANLEDLLGEPFTSDQKESLLKEGLSSLKETFGELDLRGITAFLWDKNAKRPCIGDHMIYGHMKAATEAISRTLPRKAGVPLHSASYTASLINQHVRCEQQFITFDRDIKRDSNRMPIYDQRSLRAMTAQGPRISLAKSEVVEAGAKLKFILKVIKNSPLTEEILRTLFEYGEVSGLGQWRNSGRGMFTFEMVKLK